MSDDDEDYHNFKKPQDPIEKSNPNLNKNTLKDESLSEQIKKCIDPKKLINITGK